MRDAASNGKIIFLTTYLVTQLSTTKKTVVMFNAKYLVNSCKVMGYEI
jgi:hypothetical protein